MDAKKGGITAGFGNAAAGAAREVPGCYGMCKE
jgi:hypothetical protein